MAKAIKGVFRIVRGLEAELPILRVGELGYATDSNSLFIGDPDEGNVKINFDNNDRETLNTVFDEIDKKIDAEPGKGLSANDLTNELLEKILDSASENFVINKIAEAQLDIEGGDVDLSGLASKDDLDEKVDKVAGYSLISDAEITRLASVSNYDDTDIRRDIDKKADINHQHDQYLTSIPSQYVTNTQLTAKGYATTSSVNASLSIYAKSSAIPTKISQLTDDVGYLTSIPAEYVTESDLNIVLTPYALIADIPTKVGQLNNDAGYLTSIPEEYITETELTDKGYATITEVDQKITDAVTSGTVDLSGYALKTEIPTDISQLNNDSNYLTTIPYEYVTETELEAELNNKVDKVAGKGLSTNDLTNEMVVKIDNAATQAFVTNAIAEAQLDGSDVDLSGYATKDELNEKAPLTHSHNISDVSGLQTSLDSKVDAVSGKSLISNAEIIRLASVDNYDDSEIRGLIPTKVSQLLNDSNYLNSVPSEYVTETDLTDKGYATIAEVDQKIADIGTSGTVNLNEYQKITDDTLSTSNKTITGAINEVNSNLVASLNGKKISDPMTKAEYDALTNKDPDMIYLVDDDNSIIGLPDYSSSDANKVLAVNSNGTALAWVDGTEGNGLTAEQAQQLQTAYEHSQSVHVTMDEVNAATQDYVSRELDGLTIPTKTSELTNDSDFVTENEMNEAIGSISVGGGGVFTVTHKGYTPPSTVYEFAEIGNEYMNDVDGKTNSLTDEEFLSNMYDDYVGTHQDGLTVSKNAIGFDNTNTYPIYEYDFKPKNYTRTILLSSGLHSYEQTAQFGLAVFIKEMMKYPYTDEGFKYLRENVRIKVIPLLNPWGYNQNPQIYGNVNKVNPNRNFDCCGSWEAFPVMPNNEWNWKGTEPFSEQETKNIANWLYYNKDIAEFWIDCHTGNSDTEHDIWCIYQSYNPLRSKIEAARTKIANHIKSYYSVTSVNDYVQMDVQNNIKLEYGEKVMGIPVLVVENSPLNDRWKTGDYEANGGSVREYATQLYTFIKEMLGTEDVVYSLTDYIGVLRNLIFENTCEQIPYYASSPYLMFKNAGSDSSDVPPPVPPPTGGDLKVNSGSSSSTDGAVSANSKRIFSDFVPVSGTSFSISSNTTPFLLLLRYFDSNKNFISSYSGQAFKTTTVTLPSSNIAYVVLQMKNESDTEILSTDVTGTLTINGLQYTLVYDDTLTLDGSSSGDSGGSDPVDPTVNKIIVSNSSLNVDEGGSASFTVKLSQAPTDTEVINVAVNNSYCSVDAATLTFNTDNYSIPQTVTVTAVEDDVEVVNTSTITLTSSNLSTVEVSIKVIDNDVVGNVMPITIGGTIGSNGSESSNPARFTSDDYIPVDSSKTETYVKVISGNISILLRDYDADKNFIPVTTNTTWATSSNEVKHTFPSNTAYLRIVGKKNDETNIAEGEVSGSVIRFFGQEWTIV